MPDQEAIEYNLHHERSGTDNAVNIVEESENKPKGTNGNRPAYFPPPAEANGAPADAQCDTSPYFKTKGNQNTNISDVPFSKANENLFESKTVAPIAAEDQKVSANNYQDPNVLKNDKVRKKNKKLNIYNEKQAQNEDGFSLTISEYEDIA